MALKKYLVFGWSGRADLSVPADKLFGTSSELPDEQPAIARDKDGWQQFGFQFVPKSVTLTENLMGGKAYVMKVYTQYDHMNGVEQGTPVLAYYEIPRGEA